MKFRNGFVTNSSSSSFVVAFKEGTLNRFTPSVLKRYPELKVFDFLIDQELLSEDWISDDDRTEIFRYPEDVDNYLRSTYCGETWNRNYISLETYLKENPEIKRVRDEAIQRINKGELVVMYHVPYQKKVKMNLIRLLIEAKLMTELKPEAEC